MGESSTKDTNPLSISLIEALAEAEDERPKDLDFNLYDHIHPAILDRLQSRGPREWRLDFIINDYHISVNQANQIFIDGQIVKD